MFKRANNMLRKTFVSLIAFPELICYDLVLMKCHTFSFLHSWHRTEIKVSTFIMKRLNYNPLVYTTNQGYRHGIQGMSTGALHTCQIGTNHFPTANKNVIMNPGTTVLVYKSSRRPRSVAFYAHLPESWSHGDFRCHLTTFSHILMRVQYKV